MFQVRPIEGYRWAVFDSEDQQVFEGTWRQCEEWLDARENLERVPRPRGLMSRCWNALFHRRSNVTRAAKELSERIAGDRAERAS